MRSRILLLALALSALPAGLHGQAAPTRPMPVGFIGMRLGQARTSLPDSTACAADSSGGEWCQPRPYQRLLFRDGVAIAIEASINFITPDSIPADTVWVRYALGRAMRMFGTPDSLRTEDGRRTLWWNWDGHGGPRRARVTGGPEPDSVGTRVATVFHLACSPRVALAECAPAASPR